MVQRFGAVSDACALTLGSLLSLSAAAVSEGNSDHSIRMGAGRMGPGIRLSGCKLCLCCSHCLCDLGKLLDPSVLQLSCLLNESESESSLAVSDSSCPHGILQARILEKEMAACSSLLAWKTPWTEEPGGL